MKESQRSISLVQRAACAHRARSAAASLFYMVLGLGALQLSFATGADPSAPGGRLVTPRSSHTATRLLDGRVLLAGGSVAAPTYVTGSAELYNPATNSWSATGSLNQSRTFHRAVLLPDGRVLVMSGQSFGANNLSSAELYDPVIMQWTYTASMSSPHFLSDPVVLPNGKVLVAGGRTIVETDNAELYDPASGTWSPTGNLLQPRSSYHATLLANGKALIAGGFSQTGAVAAAELYDPSTGTFSGTGSILTPRAIGNIQILLGDGKVLFAGGFQQKRDRTKFFGEAEIYDPATGLWTRVDSLRTRRTNFTANLLSDGKVFCVGGTDSSFHSIASIEEYSPATGRWELLKNSLANPRAGHTATTLLNGDVIVAGGSDIDFLPTAELFIGPR